MKEKKVVVVAPTFNERGSIEKVVRLILEQNGKVPGFDIHVLVADSHSPDGTGELAKKLVSKNPRVHFLDVVERGLGLAIIKGYEYALKKIQAEVLMQIDADLQHDPNDIPKFLQKISEGYEYVQGSRLTAGGKNNIAFSRQMFTIFANLVLRLLTGIWKITDFTPSYKAYTKNLFLRMNWQAVPWHGTTFLIQPAAVVEAARAGAKMTEVPIIFRNRRADRSKNEIMNYIIDIFGYAIEVRLSKWGMNLPILFLARRSKTFIKFGTVGFTGTLVDFIFYKLFIAKFGFTPPNAKLISTILAIQNNFFFNNVWTFKKRKTKNSLILRWLLFNLVSSGGVIISYGVVYLLHALYGDGFIYISKIHIAYNNFYFFATIPPVMTWNFLMNHFVTWKKED
ncbi:MAG: glycosyltransferase [Candidatus Daviesbacteria bacterium]|nr:MAG: glycosyltransferase [Candidatus Daviesbacteria bacterium]